MHTNHNEHLKDTPTQHSTTKGRTNCVHAWDLWLVEIYHCHLWASESTECDDEDDDGNNYLIAVTNGGIELNPIDFCVDSCGGSFNVCMQTKTNIHYI